MDIPNHPAEKYFRIIPVRLWVIVLLWFVAKSFLAANTELGNDEVYYWTYAQKLQWSYFDHPPVIAVLIKLFTLNLSLDTAFVLRFGAICCGAISTFLIYQIGSLLKDEQTGYMSALLFIASPYSNIIAGFLLIPDAPQMVFWCWSVLLMIKICQPAISDRRNNHNILLSGLSIGLCILSKVHGIFLGLGFLIFAFFFQKELFRKPAFYVAILICLVCILPILYWNFSNDFITYGYHGNRVGLFGQFHGGSFLRELIGEFAYNNPINMILLVGALIGIIRHQNYISLLSLRLLLLLSLPLIATVLFISLFNDTLPHWSGPAYSTLIPLTAAAIRSRQQHISHLRAPRVVRGAVVFITILLVLAFCCIRWLPLNIGSTGEQELGRHDVSLDMNGWEKFARQFDTLYQHDVKRGDMKKGSFLLADYWFPAAHLDYYVANPMHINFLAIGDLQAIHHYAWLNKERSFLHHGDDAYYVSVSNYFSPPQHQLTQHFKKVLTPTIITQFRSGIAVRNFFIYRCKNYVGNIPNSGVPE